MRPIFPLFDALVSLNTLTQAPLIAGPDLGYDRQFLPVEAFLDHGEPIPTSGEAEMDRKRSNQTNSDPKTDQSMSDPQPETRQERLARIRAEIDSGVYETPEKLEIAISRMMGVLTD